MNYRQLKFWCSDSFNSSVAMIFFETNVAIGAGWGKFVHEDLSIELRFCCFSSVIHTCQYVFVFFRHLLTYCALVFCIEVAHVLEFEIWSLSCRSAKRRFNFYFFILITSSQDGSNARKSCTKRIWDQYTIL